MHRMPSNLRHIVPSFYINVPIAISYSFKSKGNKCFSSNFIHNFSVDCLNYKTFLKSKMSDFNIQKTLKVYRSGSTIPDDKTTVITITQQENELFKLLLNCVSHYSLGIDLRVVGGWVRDKLLGNESKDIDIALPEMTGVMFCEHLNRYTKEIYNFERTIGVVKRCPDQSKHLETATMNILGFDVDFVNLRSEDYASGTRIPDMEFGTPTEDAVRRDFTVNSLFYNLTKDTIEDYTGLGIDDLNECTIRTCNSVLDTFLDDPLRVIRAARFAARLNFRLHDDILVTITNKSVLQALRDKVSRSRISQELDNILLKGDTAYAFSLMSRYNILNLLLGVGVDDVSEFDEITNKFGLTSELIDSGCEMMAKVKEFVNIDGIERRYLYLGAFTSPLRDLKNVGKINIYDYLIKDRLKLPNKHASSANIISDGGRLFSDIVDNLPESIPDLRLKLGLVIRKIGPLWKESLILCMAELGYGRDRYNSIIASINDLNLNNIYEIKAAITGKDLLEILPRLTMGPKFKEALDRQIEMQIYNVDVTVSELKEMLRSSFPEFR